MHDTLFSISFWAFQVSAKVIQTIPEQKLIQSGFQYSFGFMDQLSWPYDAMLVLNLNISIYINIKDGPKLFLGSVFLHIFPVLVFVKP